MATKSSSRSHADFGKVRNGVIITIAVVVAAAVVCGAIWLWRAVFAWREVELLRSPNGVYVAATCVRFTFEDWAVAIRGTAEPSPGVLVCGWTKGGCEIEWADNQTLILKPRGGKSSAWVSSAWRDVAIVTR